MNAVAPSLAEDVAVLYVDPGGPYPGLVRHWYDEARDAKTYAGPWPVVAHPPCGPWGRLKFLCTKQDASAGPHGVAMVQRWGGVLEHPEHSTLFRHCKLPRPGELADEHGGRTYAVRQVAWGHPCEKRTWLYVVGVAPAVVLAGLRTDGRPTHRVTNGSRGDTSLPRANGGVQRFYMCRGYVADKYGDGASHFPDSMRFHEHELIAYVPVALPNGDPSGGAK